MRIAIFANPTGTPTYPGGKQDWKGSRVFTLVGHPAPEMPDGEYIIGRYIGDKTEGELRNHSDQSWPPKKYRTQVTFQEFVDLFGSDNWVKVEELVETSNAGGRILKWLEKQTGTFPITNAEVVTLLGAIDNNTSIDTQEIRKGVLV